jgi:hypothetical protein
MSLLDRHCKYSDHRITALQEGESLGAIPIMDVNGMTSSRVEDRSQCTYAHDAVMLSLKSLRMSSKGALKGLLPLMS